VCSILDPKQSVAVCARLLGDLVQVQSADEAADWVHRNLAGKNTLNAADASLVEAAFRDKLAAIEAASAADEQPDAAAVVSAAMASGRRSPALAEEPTSAPGVLPKSPNGRRGRLAAKTIRLRDKDHCKFVATQPCIICGRTPTEAHHIRFAQPRALGRKVSDEYTVPVCRLHHRDLHGYGDEASWWAGVAIDPMPIALKLWRQSRPFSAPETADS
jgi:hypothetical protein